MFIRLASAIWSAARVAGRTSPRAAVVHALYRRMLVVAFRDPLDLGSLAVDGDDLRRAGIPAGPELGKILRSLMSAVIDDPARNTTDWLLQEARRLHESSDRAS
jgi:tRNA nucleotidyltransferase (CCA-adding enzyme)